MSVRRPAPGAPSRATAPGKVAHSRRLDAVLRAGQAHLVATGSPPQDTAKAGKSVISHSFGPLAQDGIKNTVTNRAALERARVSNQQKQRAVSQASAVQTVYLPMQAKANASDRPLTAEEARRLREMEAKIVELNLEAETASASMKSALQEAERTGSDAQQQLEQVWAEMARHVAAKGEVDAELESLRTQVKHAIEELGVSKGEVDQLKSDNMRQDRELAEGKARLEEANALLASLTNKMETVQKSSAANKEAELNRLRKTYETQLESLNATLRDEQRQREDAVRIAEFEAAKSAAKWKEELTAVDTERQGGQIKAEKLEAQVKVLKSKLAECEEYLLHGDDDESDDEELVEAIKAQKMLQEKAAELEKELEAVNAQRRSEKEREEAVRIAELKLAEEVEKRRRGESDAGRVRELVRLVRDGNARQAERAVGILRALANNPSNRGVIVDMGAIPALQALATRTSRVPNGDIRRLPRESARKDATATLALLNLKR